MKSSPRHLAFRQRFALALMGSTVFMMATIAFAVTSPASHACSTTGKLAGLIDRAGKYSFDLKTPLENDPAILARLDRLPKDVRDHLHRNLGVQGPIDLVSCHLVLSGNAAHQGDLENAILDVNLYSGAVTVGLFSAGKVTIYLDKDPTAGMGYTGSVPIAVRSWAANAANGFHLVNQVPPNTQVVRPQ